MPGTALWASGSDRYEQSGDEDCEEATRRVFRRVSKPTPAAGISCEN